MSHFFAEPEALTGLDDEALRAAVESCGGKPFQARQISHWLYRHGASDWDAMRNVPKTLKQALAQRWQLRSSKVVQIDRAQDGTEKLLLRMDDGGSVETVIIPDDERLTICISSQVGCPVACAFCASGLDGVKRNLRGDEIVEQFLHARDRLAEQGLGQTPARFTNLVVMGLGEPMLNLDGLLPGLERLHDADGINLGARRITVSTSGHPRQMRRFAEVPHSYGLAVSLHAADDELRKQLVPTAYASVAEIVAAARNIYEARGREVTFEIVLLDQVNDRPQDADALIRRLRRFPTCTVNLIPWNPVDRIPQFSRPAEQRVHAFADRLRHGGLNVTLRRQRGADSSAACGQLRLHDLQRSGGAAAAD